MWTREERREFVWRTLEAFAFIIRHTLVAAAFIVCFGLLHKLILAFEEPKVFGWLPLSYVFDAIDLAILAIFLLTGTIEAIRVFWTKTQ